MNKIPRLAALLVLAVATLNAWSMHYSYTFDGNEFSASGQTISLGTVNWTLTTDGGYFGGSAAKGCQIGSSKKPARTLKLVSSGITGNINTVKVTTSGANGISATLSVSAGSTTMGAPVAVKSSSTELIFTGNATGEVTLNYQQTSSKALYISKIEIQTDGSQTPQPQVIPTVTSISGFLAQPSGSEVRLYFPEATDARVTFVNGQDAYIRDATGALVLKGFVKKGSMVYNQHLAGYITGRRSSEGNMPIMEATEHSTLTRLIVADPVEEDNVEPLGIKASQLSQHYADWVTISNMTMTDTAVGQDETGNVRLGNVFNQHGYQIPVVGDRVTVTGIVVSTAMNDDFLGLAGNVAEVRSYNPTVNFSQVYPMMTTVIPNAIDMIKLSKTNDTTIYDIGGRRVVGKKSHLLKGVYIIGGRKVIIK